MAISAGSRGTTDASATRRSDRISFHTLTRFLTCSIQFVQTPKQQGHLQFVRCKSLHERWRSESATSSGTRHTLVQCPGKSPAGQSKDWERFSSAPHERGDDRWSTNPLSAAQTSSKTVVQSPIFACLNSLAVGYQNVSSRSSNHRLPISIAPNL